MRALESSVCMDAACRCPMHRLPDIGMLAVWDLDLMQMRLSGSQARLLACLLPPGRLVPTRELLRRLYGPIALDSESALGVLMGRLRRKLPPGVTIETHAGIGYRLVMETHS